MIEVIKVSDCINNIGDYDVPIHNAIIIPQNATNGDVIKAMFSVVGFTPLTWHISSDRKEGFHVHIENCFKDDFQLSVSKDWWNAPYNAESEGYNGSNN